MTDNMVRKLEKKLRKQKAKTAFAKAEISVLMRHLEKFNALVREHERACDALKKANRDIADLTGKVAMKNDLEEMFKWLCENCMYEVSNEDGVQRWELRFVSHTGSFYYDIKSAMENCAPARSPLSFDVKPSKATINGVECELKINTIDPQQLRSAS